MPSLLFRTHRRWRIPGWAATRWGALIWPLSFIPTPIVSSTYVCGDAAKPPPCFWTMYRRCGIFPRFITIRAAREGLKSPGAAESYQKFLAIRKDAKGDPLVADAKRRAQ